MASNKYDEYVHFQKINIFGMQYVGKSSLISLMENYDSDIFQLDFNSKKESLSFEYVEQVKQIEINFNENKNLYFNVYESNLDRFDLIKMNLQILLIQTECIIIMWDNSSPKTFELIPELISTIEDILKQSEIKPPIFVLQNKMDLEFDEYEISYTKDKFFESINKLKENSNIIYKEITLKNKRIFSELLIDLEKKLNENSLQNENDIYNVKYHYPLKEIHSLDKNSKFINCLLLGNEDSGKKSFLKSLVEKPIPNLLSTTGINISTFCCEVNGEIIYLRIIDTKGQEKFRSLPKKIDYQKTPAMLFFFDVTNEESFESVQCWIEDLEFNGRLDQFELFIVANKFDETEKRINGRNKGKDLAFKYNAKYFEISCLKKINIYELFNEIGLMAYKKLRGFKVLNKDSLYKFINY